jgi:hypothetical protein
MMHCECVRTSSALGFVLCVVVLSLLRSVASEPGLGEPDFHATGATDLGPYYTAKTRQQLILQRVSRN